MKNIFLPVTVHTPEKPNGEQQEIKKKQETHSKSNSFDVQKDFGFMFYKILGNTFLVFPSFTLD